MKLLCWVCLLLGWLHAAHGHEPIQPLPTELELDLGKARLGYLLYNDTRLSRDSSISCASCHDPFKGGVDHRPVSTGVEGRRGQVNAPTTWNSTFNFRQFWNGRAADLRAQAYGPVHNPVEMGMTAQDVNTRLRSVESYRVAFREIYGREPNLDDAIDAIVEFEKGLITPNAPFDRYLRGELALSSPAREGYRLFKTLGCISCHNGINVGGNSYQYLGVVVPLDSVDSRNADRFAVTGQAFDRNRYKVPTLRNVTETAPYFHDGSVQRLDEAVRLMAYHNLGYDLSQQEVDGLLAFLRSLRGETPWILQKLGLTPTSGEAVSP